MNTQIIKVKTNKGIMTATVLKENAKTWVVQLPDRHIVKRHKVKHAVEEK
jgi:hypothetical protein